MNFIIATMWIDNIYKSFSEKTVLGAVGAKENKRCFVPSNLQRQEKISSRFISEHFFRITTPNIEQPNDYQYLVPSPLRICNKVLIIKTLHSKFSINTYKIASTSLAWVN
ncbi:hypothetical protein QM480_02505 [Flectobacillus sp. DC10W]|jgi:hypothetical protein|uniref:Uncharacterized protein n=1 Tax=Flectobacillus longus TaxID=2984207 RepID=A0ABT6YHW9_9BACT|nr:hypothetical protein [Flectobacillus longus]MDI9863177.1 hypothetical protein [Flectobacillus longus]